MAYFTPEDIRQAKQLDLLTYLQIYEPDQLIKVSGDTYCTKEHDSLKISNGKWHWFSRQIGGKTALDYLVKVKGCSFLEAIHDYFFARTLDKVRPGGVVAFITSKGTMDKENPSVRKYIAQRADLLGAIRLPNDTFKAAAGTEVTSDILFLQKRSGMTDLEPDWVHLDTDENGLKMNAYFVSHPDMILGEMREVSGPYGMETACIPHEGQSLEAA